MNVVWVSMAVIRASGARRGCGAPAPAISRLQPARLRDPIDAARPRRFRRRARKSLDRSRRRVAAAAPQLEVEGGIERAPCALDGPEYQQHPFRPARCGVRRPPGPQPGRARQRLFRICRPRRADLRRLRNPRPRRDDPPQRGLHRGGPGARAADRRRHRPLPRADGASDAGAGARRCDRRRADHRRLSRTS